MADVITRFKLETTQYDSKLRDAAKGLKEFTHQAQLGGKNFTDFSQKATESARALGTVASGATNTKEKVRDLVGAYNEAAKAYNSLNQTQQQTDFGKNLAASLETLKGRITEAKQELYGLGDAMSKSGGGGLFAGLGDKMSGALQVFGGNLMTKGAGMLAGLASEMGDMVKQGVELARQGEGIRIAFERLGRGDILQGLRDATHGTVTDIELMKAAVKFNDFKLPVEELGTMLAFAQQKAKDTGQSVDYMVDSIVTGLGRKSLMILDNLGLSATEVRDKMAETGDMTKAVGAIIREQMAKAGDYVETAADRAAQANVSLQNKMEELGRKFAPLQEASNNMWTSMKIGILDVVGGPLTNLLNKLTEAGRLMNAYGQMGGSGKVGRMTQNLLNAREENRESIYQQQQAKIWDYINRRENYMKDRQRWVSGGAQNEELRQRLIDQAKSFGTSNVNDIKAQIGAAKKLLADYQQAAKQILQPIEQKIVPTVAGSTGGSGGSGFDISRIAFNQPSNDKIVKPEDYIAVPSVWEQYGQEIVKSMNTTGDAFEQAIDKLSLDNWSGDAEVLNFLKKFAKYGDDAANSWRAAGSAISTVGSAVSGLDDNAGKIMSIIGEAIANIAAAAGIATKKAADKSVHWTEYVGASAGIIATMVSAISTVHSSTGYAQGGIVEGNSYSGDNMMFGGDGLYGLNAGELVLTKAQQGNLAHALQGGAFGGMHLTARLDGKDLLLSIDRTGQTLGYGQLVFFH